MRKQALFLFLLVLIAESGFSQSLPKVKIETKLGEIVLEVDTVRAPVTGKNFLGHVLDNTFENAMFYRVVRPDNQPGNKTKIEVIQGGLFSDEEILKHPAILHETTKSTGLKHLNGTVSMARNEPGTASTEFFICIGKQPELDFGGRRNPDGAGFAAFGKVVSGMEVVRRIQEQNDTSQYLVQPLKMKLSLTNR